MSDELDWSDYESGPFCRHWSDPSICDCVCGTCGHECRDHEFGTPGECLIAGCICVEWNGKERADTKGSDTQ